MQIQSRLIISIIGINKKKLAQSKSKQIVDLGNNTRQSIKSYSQQTSVEGSTDLQEIKYSQIFQYSNYFYFIL